MLAFVVLVFAFPVFADSREDIEVTLGFGWRNSDRDLAMIENYIGDSAFPFTVVIRDEEVLEHVYKGHYVTLDYYNAADVSLVKRTTDFHKRGSFVFGVDFPLYKELIFGFELNVGFMERKIKMFHVDKCTAVDKPSYYSYNYDKKYELNSREIIIPINFFLKAKYKFEQVKDATRFLRPYVGIGGGITTAINFADRLIGDQFTQLPDEKIGVYGFGVGMAGIDLWITKKLAVFSEARFVKMFGDESHIVFVGGLRLI